MLHCFADKILENSVILPIFSSARCIYNLWIYLIKRELNWLIIIFHNLSDNASSSFKDEFTGIKGGCDIC